MARRSPIQQCPSDMSSQSVVQGSNIGYTTVGFLAVPKRRAPIQQTCALGCIHLPQKGHSRGAELIASLCFLPAAAHPQTSVDHQAMQ
jgi:hypothetical protein